METASDRRPAGRGRSLVRWIAAAAIVASCGGALAVAGLPTAGRAAEGGAVAGVAASSPKATWSGAASRGFRPWGQIQDGTRDAQFGRSSISIVSPAFARGGKAFRFQVDSVSAANGPRAELADAFQLTEGSDWWFGDVLYVPRRPNLRLGWANSNHTVLQFKNAGTGAPPLALDIREWGNASSGLGVGDLRRWRQFVPMSRLYDRAVPIEIHVRFSADSARGEYEIWAAGRRVVSPTKAQTLFPNTNSGLKQGLYGEGRGNVVYWLGVKRGTSRAAVATR